MSGSLGMRLSFQALQVSSHLELGKLIPRLFLVLKENEPGPRNTTTQLPNNVICSCPILSLLFRNAPWLDSTCTSCIADNLSRIYRFVNVSGRGVFQVRECFRSGNVSGRGMFQVRECFRSVDPLAQCHS